MKILIAFLIFSAIVLFHFYGGSSYLSFTYLKNNIQWLMAFFESNPVAAVGWFAFIYLFLTSLAIPGSIILTVLAGTLFGVLEGALLVTILGTLGACLSFLMSRYLFKTYLSQKFQRQFEVINNNLKKGSVTYILGVRFIPISPYVVVNMVLGLTQLKLWTFCWTTFVGMLPGNLIYVYAGTKLREFKTLSDIMTPAFLLSLTMLACLPFLVRKLSKIFQRRLIHT